MKISRHIDDEQIRFCDRCGSVSAGGARSEAAREAAQFKMLMMSGARLV